MRWQIFYDDSSTWPSPGFPPPVKRQGVIAVVQSRADVPERYHVIYGTDYYLWDGSFWLPVYANGLEDYILNKLEQVECVLKGRTINNAAFREIYEKATEAVRTSSLDHDAGLVRS